MNSESTYTLPVDSRRLQAAASSSSVPEYQKPHQLVSFSYSPTRELEFTDAALKYFVDPPRDADLSYGYEKWIKRPEEKSRLDGLLTACLMKNAKTERKRADVITWRGVLTKIFTAPYEHRDKWSLNVMIVGKTMYLEEHLTDEELLAKANMTAQHDLMSYYGYSFESFCTKSRPDEPPPPNGWGGDVNTNVQWCSVVKTKLNDLRIIIGGEVDCVRDRYISDPDTFVELKTSQEIRSGYKTDKKKFEQKLLKFFTQSFLLGVPEIVVGFRSPEGIVKQVIPFKTRALPKLVRESTRQWDPIVCRVWADEALHFIRSAISHSEGREEQHVWRVHFEPGSGLRLWRLGSEEIQQVSAGEDRVGFLHREYWLVVKGLAKNR